MRIKNTAFAVKSLLEARIYKKRTPLIISWSLTARCNLRCKYCNIWNVKEQELETSQIFSIIEELSWMGTRMIQFTGGEPLLRDDLGQIIDFCKEKGMNITINSNGLLVEKKIGMLKNIDFLCLSLDGCESAHDYLRGEGSYRGVIQAAKIAKDKNIRLRFATVLSSVNLNEIDFILHKAKEFDAKVLFQPATANLLAGIDPNPVAAPQGEYQRTIMALLAKKMKNKYIANSVAGLNYISNWPRETSIRCLKGLVACRIESNGDVYICPRIRNKIKAKNCLKNGFQQAFYNLAAFNCNSCWCVSNLEINLLLAFKFSAIVNAIKLI